MKKAISMILVALMFLTFAGCGDKTIGDEISTTQATTTRTTTIYPTTTPTTPGDDTLYQPEDIPQEYWAVLNNQQEIYFNDYPMRVQEGYDISWKDVTYLDVIMLGSTELAASTSRYCVLDMDSDGESELLILDGQVLVLSEKDGVVYGWDGLGPVDVYTDGTYSWGKQAGYNYGRSRMVYVGLGNWTSAEVWRVDRYMLDEPKYYITQEWVTKETYDDFMDRYKEAYNPEYVEWKELSRYPLYSRDEKYPPLNGG